MSDHKMREVLDKIILKSENYAPSMAGRALYDIRQIANAALAQPPISCNYGQNCEHCEPEHGCRPVVNREPESTSAADRPQPEQYEIGYPSVPKKSWINCEQRPVTTADGDCHRQVWTLWKLENGRYQVHLEKTESVRFYDQIIGWMPTGLQVPEPPQGESK